MEPTRLYDIPEYQLAKYPKERPSPPRRTANGNLLHPGGHRHRRTHRPGPDALGVKPGDKVAIASGNRSEWCLVDQADPAHRRHQRAHLPHQQRRGLRLRAEALRVQGVLLCQCRDPSQGQGRTARLPGLQHLFTFEPWTAPAVDRSAPLWPTTRDRRHPEELQGASEARWTSPPSSTPAAPPAGPRA